jgi:hypothetical protein
VVVTERGRFLVLEVVKLIPTIHSNVFSGCRLHLSGGLYSAQFFANQCADLVVAGRPAAIGRDGSGPLMATQLKCGLIPYLGDHSQSFRVVARAFLTLPNRAGSSLTLAPTANAVV